MANNTTITTTLKFKADVASINQALSQIQKTMNGLQMPKTTSANIMGNLQELQRYMDKYQKYLNGGLKTKGDITGLEKTGAAIKSLYSSIAKDIERIDPKKLTSNFENINSSELKALESTINNLKTSLGQDIGSNFKTSLESIATTIGDVKERTEGLAKISTNKNLLGFQNALNAGDLQAAEKALASLEASSSKFKGDNFVTWTAGVAQLRQTFDGIMKDGNIQRSQEEIAKLQSAAQNLKVNGIQEGVNQFKQFQSAVASGIPYINKYADNTTLAAQSQYDLNNATTQFGTRIKYFFTAANAVRIFRQAVRGAYDTVKELDKVMTETAVVTKFDVSDMWDQLPTYAENASKLGISIKSAYESATLYYQQGLKTNQVMELSNQTLKMARIAGLEAEEATNRMTNALRGFNMELDQTSAERVADVYSKIASMTASNVDEISTAMTKTASLADSANMSFENTAAFLSQIIETTRESADTAGTALKTVIARFAELKNNPAEIISVEGEEVSYNKVDKALQSVGISLQSFMNGTEGLDSVFMRLSEKWDSLDLATQRYIATMAAGSRQQSRFIALMQDYARMQELTTAAANAGGASNEQYAKTLDSLESKLAKLKNQWDEFTMGLANSAWIKGIVDFAQLLLKTINAITDKFGDLGGAIVKIGALIATFSMGRRIANPIANLLGPEITGKAAQDAGQTAGQHFQQGLIQAFGKGGGVYGKELGAAVSGLYTNAINDLQASKIKVQDERAQAVENGASEAELQKYDAQLNQITASTSTAAQAQAKFEAKLGANNGIIKLTSVSMEELNLMVEKGIIDAETAALVYDLQSKKVQQCAMAYGKLILGLAAVTSFASSIKSLSQDTQKGLKTISGMLTKMAVILMTLPSIIKAIGLAIDTSFPILLIIAAALTVIIEIVKQIVKVVERKSVEGRLEATKNALDQVNQQLSETSDAIEDITSKKEDIDNLTASFANLVEGSREFTDNLIENNKQMMDLLNTYPELAKAVTTGAYGQITFDEKLYNEVMDELDARERHLTNIQLGLSTYQSALENEKQFKDLTAKNGLANFLDNVTLNVGGGLYTDGQTQLLRAIDEAIENGKFTSEKIEELAENYNVTSENVLEIGTKLTQLKAENQANKSTTEGMLSAQLTTMGNSSYVNTAFGKALINSIATARSLDYSTKVGNQVEELRATYASDESRIRAYMELMGYKDREDIPEEMRTNTELILQALATDNIQTAMINAFDSFYSKYSKNIAKSETASNFFNTMTGDVKNANPDMLQLFDEEQILDAIQATMDETGIAFADLCELYGAESVTELAWMFRQAQAGMIEEVSRMRQLLGNRITTASKGVEKDALRYAKAVEKLDYERQLTTSNILDRIESAGVDLGKAFLEGVESVTSTAEFDELTSFINTLDFTNAIASARSLNNAILNNQSANIQQFATNALNTGEYGPGKQLQQYFMSSDYTDKLKEIEKKANKGKLDIKYIEELMSASENLTTLVEENGAVSKANLTEIIRLLTTTDITIQGLTNRVVKAIDKFNSFQSVVAETANTIKEMDFGESSSGLIDSMNDQIEDFKELIDNNAFGDTQVQNYLKYFYGDTSGMDTIESIQAAADKISRYGKGNGINFWDDYATGAAKAAEGLKLVKKAQGEYDITIAEGLTTKELAQRLADANNLSLETAIALLTKLTSLNPKLQKVLEQGDFNKAMQQLVLESQNVGKYIAFSAEELETLAAFMGKDIPEVLSDIQTQFGDQFSVIEFDISAVFTDSDGNAIDPSQYAAEFTRQFSEGLSSIDLLKNMNLMYNNGNIDYTGAVNQFVDMGATEEEAKKIAESFADDTDTELQKTFTGLKWDPTTQQFEAVTATVASTTIDGLEEAEEKWQQGLELGNLQNAVTTAVYDGFVQAIDDVLKKYGDVFNLPAKAIEAAQSGTSEQALTDAENKVKQKEKEVQSAEKKLEQTKKNNAKNNTPSNVASRWLSALTGNLFYGQASGQEVATAQNEVNAARAQLRQAQTELDNLKNDSSLAAMDQNLDNTKSTDANTEALNALKEQIKNDSGPTLTGKTQTVTGNYGKPDKDEANGEKAKKATSEITNNIDELYNLLQKIKTAQQYVNNYTKAYNNMLQYSSTIMNGQKVTLTQLLKLRLGQVNSYKAETNLLQEQIRERKAAARELASEYSDYFSYDQNTNSLKIDYNAINAFAGEYDTSTDESKEAYDARNKEYKKITDALSKAEGYVSDIDSATSELFDIQAQIEEIKTAGLSEYVQLEDRIATALQNIAQQQIDKLTNIKDAITTSNERIVSQIQTVISEQRAQRQRDEAADALEEKRRRLNYLKQDTSGGNRKEILALQEEIAQGEQDYTDSLIDAAISKIEQQNDIANEQMQRQIDLITAINEWNMESGAYNLQAMSSIVNSFDETTGAFKGKDSQVWEILYNGEGWGKKTTTALEEEFKTLDSNMLSAGQYLALNWDKAEVDLLKGYAKGSDLSILGDINTALSPAGGDSSLGKYVKNNNSVIGKINTTVDTISDTLTKMQGSLTSIASSITGLITSGGSSGNTGLKNYKAASITGDNKIGYKQGWNGSDSEGWWYQTTAAGTKRQWYQNGWAKVDGAWYYFNDEGYVDYDIMDEYFDGDNYNGVSDFDFNQVFKTATGATTTNTPNNTKTTTTPTTTREVRYNLGETKTKNLKTFMANKFGYSFNNEDGIYDDEMISKVTQMQNLLLSAGFSLGNSGADGKYGQKTYEALNAYLKKMGIYGSAPSYLTGGIVDFTGLAWLDGTKSKPELVLNSNDTTNLLNAVKLLNSMTGSLSTEKQNNGVTYYNVDINVEEIANDYDVDSMMNEIERSIVKAANYRNNTAVQRS